MLEGRGLGLPHLRPADSGNFVGYACFALVPAHYRDIQMDIMEMFLALLDTVSPRTAHRMATVERKQERLLMREGNHTPSSSIPPSSPHSVTSAFRCVALLDQLSNHSRTVLIGVMGAADASVGEILRQFVGHASNLGV